MLSTQSHSGSVWEADDERIDSIRDVSMTLVCMPETNLPALVGYPIALAGAQIIPRADKPTQACFHV